MQTQIDQSNILSATQTVNQLAGAVVNLAAIQLGTTIGSEDTFPLADLLSSEPFVGQLKNLKKDSVPKFDAADSAMATLKGIKSLAELCSDDSSCQDKIVDYGVLCLLRRFLLRDDYEKLTAIEAYDASRTLEAKERNANAPSDSTVSTTNDPSSIRIPPTAHIRRHAARLLTILSLLPKVQKVIIGDEVWRKWLEDCANGKIPGCNDAKLQSYARATLLNVFCSPQIDRDSVNRDSSDTGIPNSSPDAGFANRRTCPRYDDGIFLINPELPHWKCPENFDQDTFQREASTVADAVSSLDTSHDGSGTREMPFIDVVFVHGIRGGPYKSWRISEDKSSTKSGLVEKIDQEAGKQGTFWPGEWLSADFPQARMFTLKYKVWQTFMFSRWTAGWSPISI